MFTPALKALRNDVSAATVMMNPAHSPSWELRADDDVDAVLFDKIRSGEYDADDPIWDSISEQVRGIMLVANCAAGCY